MASGFLPTKRKVQGAAIMTMESRILSALRRYKNGASKRQLSRVVGEGIEFGGYIMRLREKGCDIRTQMVEGVNAEGKAIRFGVYVLRTKK